MNNKYLVISLVGLLMVSGVFAMLVTYLSNSVSISATSNSPLTIKFTNAQTTGFSQDVTFSDSLATATVFGGESIIFDLDLKNQANASITNATEEIKFDSTNISTSDFTVDYMDNSTSGSVALCTDGVSVYAYIGSPLSMVAGEELPHTVTVTMNQNTVGTYTANTRIISDSARVC